MRIAVPDLVSNSYFPAVAAVELGYAGEEDLELELELLFPVTKTMQALRDGELDFVAGSAHSTLTAFPQWQGAKLLVALAQYMYWFLVLRADINATQGDISALAGLNIGAAPGVDIGLKGMLAANGIDPENDLQIGPVPGAAGAGTSFGVTAARALEDGKIDGFWANGMGAEVAVRNGSGKVLLDIRRSVGPGEARFYTFPALVTSNAVIEREPEAVAAAIRAVLKAQNELKRDPGKSTVVGKRLFPPAEANLIAALVERDLPYYQPGIPEEIVEKMNIFAQDVNLLTEPVPYEDVVATQFSHLWAGVTT